MLAEQPPSSQPPSSQPRQSLRRRKYAEDPMEETKQAAAADSEMRGSSGEPLSSLHRHSNLPVSWRQSAQPQPSPHRVVTDRSLQPQQVMSAVVMSSPLRMQPWREVPMQAPSSQRKSERSQRSVLKPERSQLQSHHSEKPQPASPKALSVLSSFSRPKSKLSSIQPSPKRSAGGPPRPMSEQKPFASPRKKSAQAQTSFVSRLRKRSVKKDRKRQHAPGRGRRFSSSSSSASSDS